MRQRILTTNGLLTSIDARALSPLALILLAACGSGASPADGATSASAPTTIEPAAPAGAHVAPVGATTTRLKHSVAPGTASTASIQTSPNAVCTLRGADETPDTMERLTVYADDEGVARLELRQVDPTADHAALALDCKADTGEVTTHFIDVDVDEAAAPKAAQPFATGGKRRLAALEENEAAALTGDELIARGFPPRPDAKASPAEYAAWSRLTKGAPAVIDPRRVDQPAFTHRPAAAGGVMNGPGASSIWSGYVIQTPPSAPPFSEIYGVLHVPQAFAEAGAFYLNYSAFWVGLDGYGTNDVVQNGTSQNTQTVAGFQGASYGAWTEWFPLSSQSVSNFPVQPGDQIATWAWVGNSQFSAPAQWLNGAFYGDKGDFVADVNGDGKADGVAVDGSSIWVTLSNGSSFGQPQLWLNGAFYGQYGTFMADVNGDGKADGVGFNGGNTWVTLSNGHGFGQPQLWSSSSFQGNKGNLMADVNGDGRADAIAICDQSAWVMLSSGSGFGAPQEWLSGAFYGSVGTTMADVNGDGKADAVGFNGGNTWVMLSTGSAFAFPQQWSTQAFQGAYGTMMADVNGDGKSDAVAFNAQNSWVMLSAGTSFYSPQQWSWGGFYGTKATLMGDINGDHKSDAVAFDDASMWTMTDGTNGSNPANVGYFYFWNETENVSTGVMSIGVPGGTTFTGHTAEWVMERPTINGSVASLASFAPTQLGSAIAYDKNGGTHSYTSDTSTQLTMTGGSGALSTVAPVDASTMQFTWHGYN